MLCCALSAQHPLPLHAFGNISGMDLQRSQRSRSMPTDPFEGTPASAALPLYPPHHHRQSGTSMLLISAHSRVRCRCLVDKTASSALPLHASGNTTGTERVKTDNRRVCFSARSTQKVRQQTRRRHPGILCRASACRASPGSWAF